jgi:hypothetical protein
LTNLLSCDIIIPSKARRTKAMKDLVIIRWDAWDRYEKYVAKKNEQWKAAEQAGDWKTAYKLACLGEVATKLMATCNDFEC